MLLAKRSNAVSPENTKAVYRTKVLMRRTKVLENLIRNAKHFKKKAVVSDSFLLKLATNALGPLLGMKHFELKEIELAWYYVTS